MFKQRFNNKLPLVLSLCLNFMLIFVKNPKSEMFSLIYYLIMFALLSATIFTFYMQVKYSRKK